MLSLTHILEPKISVKGERRRIWMLQKVVKRNERASSFVRVNYVKFKSLSTHTIILFCTAKKQAQEISKRTRPKNLASEIPK